MQLSIEFHRTSEYYINPISSDRLIWPESPYRKPSSLIVIYFPEGIMGWLREKYPERFGEVVDEKDRKAQVELK